MDFKVDIKYDYRGDIRKYYRESKVFRWTLEVSMSQEWSRVPSAEGKLQDYSLPHNSKVKSHFKFFWTWHRCESIILIICVSGKKKGKFFDFPHTTFYNQTPYLSYPNNNCQVQVQAPVPTIGPLLSRKKVSQALYRIIVASWAHNLCKSRKGFTYLTWAMIKILKKVQTKG